MNVVLNVKCLQATKSTNHVLNERSVIDVTQQNAPMRDLKIAARYCCCSQAGDPGECRLQQLGDKQIGHERRIPIFWPKCLAQLTSN